LRYIVGATGRGGVARWNPQPGHPRPCGISSR
jgi:hypothetical protein